MKIQRFLTINMSIDVYGAKISQDKTLYHILPMVEHMRCFLHDDDFCVFESSSSHAQELPLPNAEQTAFLTEV